MKTTTPAPEGVSVKDASAKYSLSPKTIRNLIASGHLPAYRIGRNIRVQRADLDALAERIPAAG
jgi:excisionase family DNA binding protein